MANVIYLYQVQCTTVSSGEQNQNETTISSRGRSRLAGAEPCKKFKIEKQFLSRLLQSFLDRNVSSNDWKKLIDRRWDGLVSGMLMLMKMMMMEGREDVERRDIEGRRYKICPAGIHSIPNRAHTRHAIPSRAICRYQICRPAGTDIIANNV